MTTGSSRPAGGRVPAGRSVAPSWLDPVLVVAERIDRRAHHIRPVRREGVIGLALTRHRGPALRLADGTMVRTGDPIGTIHLLNARLGLVAGPGWQTRGLAIARDDLAALARWWPSLPPERRPVAFHGVTVLVAFARRERWEVRPRLQTRRTRLDDWFMRWLLVHFARGGRERLRQGHHALTSMEAWLSAGQLAERYAAPSPGTGSERS
jgi:YkoP domain